MNISYSFTVPESLAVISLVALILFLAVWLLMLLDVFRKILARHRQKTHGEYRKYIQRKEEVERKAHHRL
ncbi:hypothetical protein JTW20_001551 [Salmonella enterica]|uniref:LapA family protein n=1 Tax=Salmonella enterica TaxID=28901 RepID=A0A760MTJ4_SALER|nr:hypothetical protein [Salmonella enterica subsp. enterica serovar Rubislaw]EDY9874044.1 hypothetical protein [Salmonella enterica]EHC2615764.1 hypothetical protein [Salmonella enterica]EHZ8573445.1 hypothetical protein [Salmonella enterica]EJI3478384.1 hypothetical protein [Salmonella enterica]